MNQAHQLPAPDADVQDIELGDEQMLVLDARSGSRVRVLAGALWLTENGRSVARLLRAREQFTLAVPGRVVLQGAGSTRIEFAQPARLRAPARVWRRLGSSAEWVACSLAVALGVAVGAGMAP